MAVSFVVTFLVMFAYYWLEDQIVLVEPDYEDSTVTWLLLHHSANILYAVAVYVINVYYARLAETLNEWG